MFDIFNLNKTKQMTNEETEDKVDKKPITSWTEIKTKKRELKFIMRDLKKLSIKEREKFLQHNAMFRIYHFEILGAEQTK